jgi:hypothetical protein
MEKKEENTHTHTQQLLSLSPPPSSDGVVCFCFFSRQESLKIERHPTRSREQEQREN